LIALIEDPDFQEDAISYLVRFYVKADRFDEVLYYVDHLQSASCRIHMAKLLLSCVISSHDQGRIDRVCAQFMLTPP